MDRLTFDGNFCDIARCAELLCPHEQKCTQRQVWERLKAYEDTGLTPESIMEIDKFTKEVWDVSLPKLKDALELLRLQECWRLVILSELGRKEFDCNA